jgi:predicted GNAT family acetyltransferase
MSSAFAITEAEVNMPQLLSPKEESMKSLRVEALTSEDQEEVLAFLSLRPIHTVCMASYIRDNGIVSPLNRGFFYGCRDEAGRLGGVALIGHATLLETQSVEAIQAFAQLKHEYSFSHLVRGEHEMIERFWRHYAQFGHLPRLARRELLYEQQSAPDIAGPVPELQRATLNDLEEIMAINAEMIVSECGIDPTKKDPLGFRERMARRIQHGRMWVWRKDGRLTFKADVFAETPDMTYVEGVYVTPQQRGQGHGLRCMSQLSRFLLQRSQSICLLINCQKKDLATFYEKAGYEIRGMYDTIYLHPEAN